MRYHYVITYPELNAADLEWIEAHRARHDPIGRQMAPAHITLAFAIEGMTDKAIVDEVRARAAGFGVIEFEIRHATMSFNPFREFYQEYLVPETGHAALVNLHDRLYEGAFAPQHRLDVGYLPHISIGRCEHPYRCKERVDALNAKGISVSGRVSALEIAVFTDGKLTPVDTVQLVSP